MAEETKASILEKIDSKTKVLALVSLIAEALFLASLVTLPKEQTLYALITCAVILVITIIGITIVQVIEARRPGKEQRMLPSPLTPDSDIQAGIIAFHKNRGAEPHLIDRYLPIAKYEIAIMAVQFNSIVHQYLGSLAQKAVTGCQLKILMMAPRDADGEVNPNVDTYQSQRTYTKLLSRLETTTDTFKKWLASLDSEVQKRIEIRQYLEHPTVSMFFVDKDCDEGFLRVEVLPYKADAHDFPNYQLIRKGDPEFYDFHKRSFNLLWDKSMIL